MSEKSEPISLLHIHAQSGPHSPSTIVGNRESFERLKVAIDAAIRKGSASFHSMTTDGEGYSVELIFRDNAWESKKWENATLPYIDDIYMPVRRGEI